MARNNNILIAS